MHHDPCPCGNPSPWIELEGRTDDVTAFTEDGKEIRIAPLSLYAVLKEVHGIRRFQLLAYPGNRLELCLEEKDGENKTEAFEAATACLEEYLASQGIRHVTVSLSEDPPQQDPHSGKFKHIVNLQNKCLDE
jgi:phenylacetate-coenzyme A ligase PaaK-like adenylate-forming protein